jgi:DNA-binding beta-propeller fold protein YncE
MDRSPLDSVLRRLAAAAVTRRGLGGAAAAAAAAGAAARLGLDETDARKKKRRKRCPDGGRRCGGRCIDTAAAPANCGACGRACGDGEACSAGFCVVVTENADPDVLQAPRNVAVDGGGNLVVVDLVRDHVERFVPGADEIAFFGGRGSADGLFDGPSGIAARDTAVFVADTGNHRIQVFDARTLRHVLSFGSRGDGTTTFNNPGGIEIDPGGDLVYVADTLNHRVKIHTGGGAFVDQFGGPGSGNGQFNLPVDVAVRNAGDGRRAIYVADLNNNRIQIIDDQLRFLGAFGRQGSGDGEFLGPRAVAVAPDGTVFVADGGNDRIQQFSADGAFLRAFGREGSAPGEFRSPEGVAVGPDGTIHVCDAGNKRVQSFKPAGSAADGAAERNGDGAAKTAGGRTAGNRRGDRAS